MSGMRITHGKMRYAYQTLGGELKKRLEVPWP
jgi:hypothetical protein